MADTTLQAIKTMVRRITRSPAPTNITDAQLNEYINTFILYDFPENLRLFNLRQTLTFYTQPYVGTYLTDTIDATDPLYNFNNLYTAVHPPVYMIGIEASYTQDRDAFWNMWPQTRFEQDTQLRGNGILTTFSGKLNQLPVEQNRVMFTATDVNGVGMVLVDYPQVKTLVNPIGNNMIGAIGLANQPINPLPTPTNQINYWNGQFTITFPRPPTNINLFPFHQRDSRVIWSETIPYRVGRPISMLYYDNKFTIRPIPDNVYPIQVEVDVRPTALLDNAQSPQFEQWWQYIALGSCLKVFRDRMDMESIQQLYPEFDKQERLVLRSTLTQQANERTETIFTRGKWYGGFFNGLRWPY